jgi:hypothetical protein
VRQEELGKFKNINAITSLGFKPTTLRLVVERLNQLRYRLPNPPPSLEYNTDIPVFEYGEEECDLVQSPVTGLHHGMTHVL